MRKIIFFLSFLIVLTTGCSVTYTEPPFVEDKIPEFVFQNASMSRFHNNQLITDIEAEFLEQYRNTSNSYGKNVTFNSYEDGQLETSGSCGYISANGDLEVYELFDNIQLENHTEGVKVFADGLKYNGKTEQLTSGKGDSVTIENETTSLRGTGFAASGVSKSYSFSGNVIGSIKTE